MSTFETIIVHPHVSMAPSHTTPAYTAYLDRLTHFCQDHHDTHRPIGVSKMLGGTPKGRELIRRQTGIFCARLDLARVNYEIIGDTTLPPVQNNISLTDHIYVGGEYAQECVLTTAFGLLGKAKTRYITVPYDAIYSRDTRPVWKLLCLKAYEEHAADGRFSVTSQSGSIQIRRTRSR